MAAESKTVSLVPLKGSNYATWQLQCRMALMKEGLWSIVSEKENPPDATEADAVAAYSARKDKALATIVLSVDPSLLYMLGDPEDPVQVWKKLASQFQRKTWANKLVLRRKLHSLRLKEGASVQKHIKEMTELFNELAVIGAELDEEDRVVHLLASLPDSYDTLVTALEVSEKVPTMELVIDRLLYEEKKTKDRQTEPDEALFITDKMKSKSKRPGIRCHYCHKLGHMQKDCYERKLKLPRKGDKVGEKHSVKRKSESCNSIGLLAATHALSTGCGTLSNSWIIDSGATCHICSTKAMFDKMENLESKQAVTLGDGRSITTDKRGTVKLMLKQPDGTEKVATLHDVLYVPELSYNLLSISKATEFGKKVRFDEPTCEIADKQGDVVGTATKLGSLYYLNCQLCSQQSIHSVKQKSLIQVWHQRYGHLNVSSLKQLAKDKLVKGLNSTELMDEMEMCESCVQGKIHRAVFPKAGGKRSDRPLGLVHTDVCGKLNTKSLGGAEYFVTFIDDQTRHVWAYSLKHKSEVFKCFLEWKAMAERSSERKLVTLRSDNGGEYTSIEFESYLKNEGIKHELTVARTPEQNGVAERMNRTLVESVRSMLVGANLPQRFWAEALATAVYLRNRSPTKSLDGLTPHEAWTGVKPSVSHLKVFGCTAFAHVSKEQRHKLDGKAKKCVFLGYGTNVKGYRLYDPIEERVFYSRDVLFDENTCCGLEKEHPRELTEKMIEINIPSNELPVTENVEPATENDPQETDNPTDAESEPVLRRSSREKREPERYGVWVNTATTLSTDPLTVHEALNSSEQKEWQQAMEEEIESIHKNHVWDLVEPPLDRRIIGSKWVFKTKRNANGTLERHKARLVAQGYSQQHGQDYDETFSPVVRFESLRTVVALAVQNGLKLHQMDVTTAFLNGELKEQVYMKQPERFVVKGKESLVCRLKKSIYGLKKSPRCWNSALDTCLKKMGFKQVSGDPCLYAASQGANVFDCSLC